MESGVSLHWQRQSEQTRGWPLSVVPCLWILGPKREAQSHCFISEKPKTEVRSVKTFEEKSASQLMYHTLSCIKRLWGHGAVKNQERQDKMQSKYRGAKAEGGTNWSHHLTLKTKNKRSNVQSSLKSGRRIALWTSKYQVMWCQPQSIKPEAENCSCNQNLPSSWPMAKKTHNELTLIIKSKDRWLNYSLGNKGSTEKALHCINVLKWQLMTLLSHVSAWMDPGHRICSNGEKSFQLREEKQIKRKQIMEEEIKVSYIDTLNMFCGSVCKEQPCRCWGGLRWPPHLSWSNMTSSEIIHQPHFQTKTLIYKKTSCSMFPGSP